MRQKLDMSQAVAVPSPNSVNTSSAALSNATHLNMALAKRVTPEAQSQPEKPAPFQPSPTDNPIQAGAKAVGNLPSSFMNFVKGLGHAVIHPIDTLTGIAKTVVGGAGELGRFLGTGAKADEPKTDEEKTFDMFKQAIVDRYGSIEKAAKTFETDPFGAGADVLSLLEGGGALAGKTELLHSYLSKVGGPAAEFVGKAGDAAGLTKIIESAKNAKIAPFGKGYKPETAEMFETAGIKPPLAAITKSKFLQGAEGLASKSPFGGKIRDLTDNALKELDKRTVDTVDSISPRKSLSEAALGEQIQKGLKDYEENFKATEGKIYDEFSKTYGKSNVYGMATKDALATLVEEQKKDFLGPDSIDTKLSSALERITGSNNPELKQLEKNFNEIKNLTGAKPEDVAAAQKAYTAKMAELDKNLTFEELKATRTHVGELLAKNPENTALKRFYGALSKDMETAVRQIGEASPLDGDAKAATDALDKLNKGYATGKNKIQGEIAQSIKQSKPENIAQNLIKNNDPKFYAQVKEMIGKEKFSEVQKYFIRDLFEGGVKNKKFDIDKFKSVLGDYDKETLTEVLTPEQYSRISTAVDTIENNQVLKDAIKSGIKITEGSQTATLLQTARVGGEISGMITTLLTGHLWAAIGIATGLITEALATRLFTTDFGRKLLTEGITPTNLKALKNMNLSGPQIAGIVEAYRYSPGETN